MGKNNELGLEGEALAKEYLQNKGWSILESNYRYKRSEIDLIAFKERMLIFVEVKTRTNTTFGQPEQFVDEKKAEMIRIGAEYYLSERKQDGNIRFDVIAVTIKNEIEIVHFEDAFY